MKEKIIWLAGQCKIIFATCLFYFVSSIPFIDFMRLSATTEVRPYCVLPFLMSLVYGLPGALGTAIGNIFSDMYYGGMDYKIYILGFSFQLIYGYGGAWVWNYLRRNDSDKFKLDKVKKLAQYLILIFFDSLIIAVMVWITLHQCYNLDFYGIGFVSTFLNHIIFFVILGIPFFTTYSSIRQKKIIKKYKTTNSYLFSINEKFILFLLLISSIIAIFFSICAYIFFSSYEIYDTTTKWSYVYFISGAALYICLWPSLIILYFVEEYISKPLEEMSLIGINFGSKNSISEETSSIKETVKHYIKYNSEIGALARSFDNLSDKIDEYIIKLTNISKEKERVSTELKIASEIQQGALPEPIQFDQIELYALMDPALEVAGDFYDYFKIDDHKFGFVIADVSGKGVPSSLFMMISKIIIKNYLLSCSTPGEALTKANSELYHNNKAEMFVTVFCGILDLDSGVLQYTSAGHDHPIISRKGENFTIMDNRTGFVLGALDDITYKDNELHLDHGDVFFVYTDGIPEAANTSHEQYGFDRMLEVMNSKKDQNITEICTALLNSIDEFQGEGNQFDDITVLAFRRN